MPPTHDKNDAASRPERRTAPRFARWLLTRLHPDNTLEEVEGDLDELYAYWYRRAGKTQATLRYLLNVVSVLPPFVRRRQRKQEQYQSPSIFSPDMIRNYFKIAWRNLIRYPAFSFINILGLAIGLACCMFILLYVQDEGQYDRYHHKAERIYRLTADITNQGKTSRLSVTPAPWAPLLTTSYAPGVKSVRLLNDKQSLVRFGDKHFYEKQLYLSDSTVFDVFTFPLLRGNPVSALSAPNTVVLSEDAARKYFGQANPVGKTLDVTPSFGNRTFTLTVTGVANRLPATSHLTFDFLVSMATLRVMGNINQDPFWQFFMFYTYLLLPEGSSSHQLERQLPSFMATYQGKYTQSTGKVEAHLQPLTDIHLRSQQEGEPNETIVYVQVFSAIAVIILLIAAINFMNLSTARSLKRAKEVGLRKAVGAGRMELVRQFLGESVLLALLALILSIAFLYALLPLFNQLAGKALSINSLHRPSFLLALFGLSIIMGLVAGLYPAMVLSNFKPVQVLKGSLVAGNQGQWLRKGLIVTQFSIASLLIVSTLVIYQQLNYIRTKSLGFDQHQIVVLAAPKFSDAQKATAFKNSLKGQNRITDVAIASDVPGTIIPANTFRGEGGGTKQAQSMQMLVVDEDFIPTVGMKLAAGRNFSHDLLTDSQEGFILNQEAVRQLGWASPAAAIGKTFARVVSDQVIRGGKVIGVVNDFNLKPFHAKIEPTVMLIDPNRFQYLYIRIKPGNPSAIIDFLRNQMRQFYPDQPFQFSFLNDTVQAMYQSEERLGKVFSTFAALAILIACLGIFGLATYAAQQRIKEIGVRKALGASTFSVFTLLSADFLKPVVVALLVASPVAWWAMNKWLGAFAYRVDISWWVFVVAGLLAVGIALLTVSFQSIKAALVNPVKSLRSE